MKKSLLKLMSLMLLKLQLMHLMLLVLLVIVLMLRKVTTNQRERWMIWRINELKIKFILTPFDLLRIAHI